MGVTVTDSVTGTHLNKPFQSSPVSVVQEQTHSMNFSLSEPLYLSIWINLQGLVIFDSEQGNRCRALYCCYYFNVLRILHRSPWTCPPEEYIKHKHFSHRCFTATICKETNHIVLSFAFLGLTLLSATPEEQLSCVDMCPILFLYF